MSRVLKALLPLFLLAFFATIASADTVVLCTEANNGATAGDGAGGLQDGGCIASIPTSSPLLYVASDGEVPFHPFGIAQDVSDAIQLNADWAPDPSHAAAFAAGFWTQLPGTFTWYLPASTPCGAENEPPPGCEPIAKWYFTPGSHWNAGTPDHLVMLDASGALSDEFFVDNTGPGGSAAISFDSSPVPEPGTLSLLGFGLVYAGRRLRRKTA